MAFSKKFLFVVAASLVCVLLLCDIADAARRSRTSSTRGRGTRTRANTAKSPRLTSTSNSETTSTSGIDISCLSAAADKLVREECSYLLSNNIIDTLPADKPFLCVYHIGTAYKGSTKIPSVSDMYLKRVYNIYTDNLKAGENDEIWKFDEEVSVLQNTKIPVGEGIYYYNYLINQIKTNKLVKTDIIQSLTTKQDEFNQNIFNYHKPDLQTALNIDLELTKKDVNICVSKAIEEAKNCGATASNLIQNSEEIWDSCETYASTLLNMYKDKGQEIFLSEENKRKISIILQ